MADPQETASSVEIDDLRTRLAEAEQTLRAIRSGEVDAVIVHGDAGEQVYTLKNADQPYRTLVEQMREGAAILTVGGDVLSCNRPFAELVAAPMEDVIGGPVDRFIPPEDREALRAVFIAGNGTQRASLAAADGRRREVYLSLTTAVADFVERRSLIVADLTELTDAQARSDRAERESRAKDEFMAMLAHELRNPLGAVAAAVQVLDAVGRNEGPEVRAREVITRQVRHLSYLINDLLDASRVVTGKITLHLRPVNFAELVRRGVAIAVGGAHQERRIDVQEEPVWIRADAVRIEQIVGNLVGNAIKFTETGGHIRVVLTAEDDEAVLRIEDDGAGIGADLLPRIFDLFVQGDAAPDRAKGGLGIGLTLVRQLVDLHRGVVTAVSDGLGRGSLFTLRLPRVAPPNIPLDAVEPPKLSKRRILVIEDNRDARDMFRLALELEGHDVIEAESGAQGLELLTAERPDIAVVDIGLPGLDGYELARRFRAGPDAQHTVLVALTGYGSQRDRERARQAGFDFHLIKPTSPDELRQLLNHTIAHAEGDVGPSML